GILAAIAIPQYRKSVEKSRAAGIMILMKAIYDSARFYQIVHGVYPKNFEQLDIEIPQSPDFTFPRQNNLANGNTGNICNCVWASRNPNSTRYTIIKRIDDGRTCCCGADVWAFACKSLGGVKDTEKCSHLSAAFKENACWFIP
ncbi:MAG: hypothetical protein LBG16_05720, partial [Elusimicrobiota bacterium]|nr:hypothetical protein [Elusimicrobiota bacterium]